MTPLECGVRAASEVTANNITINFVTSFVAVEGRSGTQCHPEESLLAFVRSRFGVTGESADAGLASALLALMSCATQYTQLFSAYWFACVTEYVADRIRAEENTSQTFIINVIGDISDV